MSEIKTTVFCSFYNEEYLLPFWLKHHVRLFDHGIMIDWDSTDKSVEIIKQLAPHWEIHKSGFKHFHRSEAEACAHLHEKAVGDSSWKFFIGCTDFLFHPNLKGYLSALPSHVDGVWLSPISPVDNVPNTPLDNNVPLVLQKTFGHIGKNEIRPTNKLIHRKKNGEWKGEGMHASYMKNTFVAEDIFHMHLKWAPWTPEFIKRKLQVQDKMTEEYKKTVGVAEMGYHITTEEEQQKRFKIIQEKYSKSLFTNPVYSYLYKEIEKSYNDKNYKFNPYLVSGEVEYNVQRIASQVSAIKNDRLFIVDNSEDNTVFSAGIHSERSTEEFLSIIFHNLVNWMKEKLKSLPMKLSLYHKKTNKVIIDSEKE